MRVAVLATISLVLTVLCARASAADPASAQALFDEGRRLMSEHRFVEACAKFEESERIDPGVGTLFHLAECEERLGKTATAWATYLEVVSEAKALGESARERAARDRAAALEARIGRLTIDPGAETEASELEIVRDGTLLGRAQWAVAVPVDPGSHTIDVRAKDKGPWHSVVEVAPGTATVVTVPLLAAVPRALPAVSSESGVTTTTGAEVPIDTSRGRGQRAAGIAISAAGVVGIGVGTYFAAVWLERRDEARSDCAGGCDATGLRLESDAHNASVASWIAFAAGGTALLGGMLTYATAPRASDGAFVSVDLGPSGLGLRGSF